MKKLILLLIMMSPSLIAERICIIGYGSWLTNFSSVTAGWPGAATDFYITGAGTASPAAGGNTWRVKHSRNGVETVITGRHACLTKICVSDSCPWGVAGHNCWCQRTLVNGVDNLGPWIFNDYSPGATNLVSDCHNLCAMYCVMRIGSSQDVRVSMLGIMY